MTNAFRAPIATISLGTVSIEGLQLQDGSYAVSVSQVAELFSVPQKHSSRTLKALLVMDCPFPKIRSGVNSKAVNILTLAQFETVLIKLDRQGNEKAQSLRDALTGTALNELFCDAFGIVSDASTRQAHMKSRMEGIQTRRSFTDEVSDRYLATHPEADKAPFYAFAAPSDKLNQRLTGHPAKYWREKFNCEVDELRDHWGKEHLDRIDRVENLAAIKVTGGMSPLEAIDFAIDIYEYDCWPEDRLTGKGNYNDDMRKLMKRRRAAAKAMV